MKTAIVIVTGIAALLWGITIACERSDNPDNREAASLYAFPAIAATALDILLIVGFGLWRLFTT